MRYGIVLALVCGLVACGPIRAEAPETSNDIAVITEPPPLPQDAETVDFDAERAEPSEPAKDTNPDAGKTVYWGVDEGEPLSIMWEDLLPEGEEEALMQAYEEFYAMLEKRYAANSTSLLDAANGMGAIAEGSELDYMPQLGTFEVVEELDGQLIRMPGYVVPFDFNTKRRHREFLFVPYMGACIHSPPPPPNQIIFVRADPAKRVKDIWAPYWIEGTLNTEKTENELGNSAYTLQLDGLKPYQVP